MPFARLTPRASRTVTIKKQNERMKISESSPDLNAMDVERHATRALWLEGMPPVRQSKSSISSDALCTFPAQSLIIVFKNCAKNQLNIQDRKTGELTKTLNCP